MQHFIPAVVSAPASRLRRVLEGNGDCYSWQDVAVENLSACAGV